MKEEFKVYATLFTHYTWVTSHFGSSSCFSVSEDAFIYWFYVLFQVAFSEKEKSSYQLSVCYGGFLYWYD